MVLSFIPKMENSNDLKDALNSWLQSANGDSGGSRRAAQFLLSLWNGNRFKVDLQELLYVDKAEFEHMQTVMRELYDGKDQLDTYVTEDQMKPVI
jgi:hypothetical protein